MSTSDGAVPPEPDGAVPAEPDAPEDRDVRPWTPWSSGVRDLRLHTPDEVLLRRYGHVRAVGSVLYLLIVAVLFVLYDTRVWPMLIGAPVFVAATVAFYVQSPRYPRAAVAGTLVADVLVLAAGGMVFGGTSSGLLLLCALPVVSAGILLGPSSATAFAAGAVVVGVLQFGLESLGVTPPLAFEGDPGDRLAGLVVSAAGLGSVGYLTAVYGSRLHELLADSRADLVALRTTGLRRREYLDAAAREVREPLAGLEALADELDEGQTAGGPEITAAVRRAAARLEAGVDMLVDVGAMDTIRDVRPEPLLLARIVEDCLRALGPRLEGRPVTVEVPPYRVVGDRRGIRRIVWELVENVTEHTPAGTAVEVSAVHTPGRAVLIVRDHGPGVPPSRAAELFRSGPEGPRRPPVQRMGLPLVTELVEAMGARVRYEPARDGGARFMVAFRLAPAAAGDAPDADAPDAGDAGAGDPGAGDAGDAQDAGSGAQGSGTSSDTGGRFA